MTARSHSRIIFIAGLGHSGPTMRHAMLRLHWSGSRVLRGDRIRFNREQV